MGFNPTTFTLTVALCFLEFSSTIFIFAKQIWLNDIINQSLLGFINFINSRKSFFVNLLEMAKLGEGKHTEIDFTTLRNRKKINKTTVLTTTLNFR